MSQKPTRDWRDIANEAARETDPGKLAELTTELERALEERDKKLGSDRAKSA